MTGFERFLLFLPIPGDVFFGLAPLLAPVLLARSLGYSGDDPYREPLEDRAPGRVGEGGPSFIPVSVH